MIKLETNYTPSSVFYFRTLDDCRKFLYVFKDHWCNVKWKPPVEVPDGTSISSTQRAQIGVDPKKRAEANLSWGFNYARLHGDDGLTPRQQRELVYLMGQI
jgi:hypothetical protein